jgi:hypothetical protein
MIRRKSGPASSCSACYIKAKPKYSDATPAGSSRINQSGVTPDCSSVECGSLRLNQRDIEAGNFAASKICFRR